MMHRLKKIGLFGLFLLVAIAVSVCLLVIGLYTKDYKQVAIHAELAVIELLGLSAKVYIDKKFDSLD